MSANLLRHAGRIHGLEDDLESILHVLGWSTLRYVPGDDCYDGDDRHEDMSIFDEHSTGRGRVSRGGRSKSWILRAGVYPSETFKARQPTPLCGLLRTLSSSFKSLYASNPPNEAIRENYEKLKQANPDNESAYLNHIVHIYDQDKEHLKSSLWSITTIEDTLGKETWPTDDKADRSLLISSSFSTDVQEAQMQNVSSQWLYSKGFLEGSKRAPSPGPELTSTKRRRCTPAASESGS